MQPSLSNMDSRQPMLFEFLSSSPSKLPPPVVVRARKSSTIKPAFNALNGPLFSAAQLDMFIGTDTKEVAVLLDGEDDAETPTAESTVVENGRYEYRLDQILRAHSYLWEQSLRALAAQGNSWQKRDVLEWIFEPALVGYVTNRNGSSIKVTNDMCAFSFDFCSKLEGADPDYVRNFIARIIPAVVAEIAPQYKIETTTDRSRFMAADTRPR